MPVLLGPQSYAPDFSLPEFDKKEGSPFFVLTAEFSRTRRLARYGNRTSTPYTR
jgi:hypothetical protein